MPTALPPGARFPDNFIIRRKRAYGNFHHQISDFINVEASQISITRAMASLALTIIDPRIQKPYPATEKKYKPNISRSPHSGPSSPLGRTPSS